MDDETGWRSLFALKRRGRLMGSGGLRVRCGGGVGLYVALRRARSTPWDLQIRISLSANYSPNRFHTAMNARQSMPATSGLAQTTSGSAASGRSVRVKLVSIENEVFVVEPEVIQSSVFLARAVNSSWTNSDDDPMDGSVRRRPLSSIKIRLPNISSRAIDKVLQYLKHHSGEASLPPTPLPSSYGTSSDMSMYGDMSGVSAWDETFVQEMDDVMLAEVILASQSLEIQPLFEISTNVIAKQIVHDMFPMFLSSFI